MSSAQYLTVEGPVETVSNRAAGVCEIVAPASFVSVLLMHLEQYVDSNSTAWLFHAENSVCRRAYPNSLRNARECARGRRIYVV